MFLVGMGTEQQIIDYWHRLTFFKQLFDYSIIRGYYNQLIDTYKCIDKMAFSKQTNYKDKEKLWISQWIFYEFRFTKKAFIDVSPS